VESTTIISPHIIARRDEDTDREYVMTVGAENALVVFRSEEEVEKFRDYSGLHPASEGFEAVPVDEVGIARTCLRHGLERVCLPEHWTGTSGVDFFDLEDFVVLLKESVVEDG
jgi:hypothetical protein